MSERPDARTDEDYRLFLRRNAREGALELLNELTDHDMATHDGRVAFRKTITFADDTRKRCEWARTMLWEKAFSWVMLLPAAAGTFVFTYWHELGEFFDRIRK